MLIVATSALFWSQFLFRNRTISDRGTEGAWKTIHVYRGPRNDQSVKTWISYSQVHQDTVVRTMWSQPGFFIDLAANDYQNLSNSFALEQFDGWDGLCIEPNINYWQGLVRRRCSLVGAVVSDANNKLVDFAMRDELGGIIDPQTDNQVERADVHTTTYRTATIDVIFKRMDVPSIIHYMSLDVEGAESMVFSRFPFQHHKVYIFTIERPKYDVLRTLEFQGYVEVGTLGVFGDTCYLHRSTPNFLEVLKQGQREIMKLTTGAHFPAYTKLWPVKSIGNIAVGVRCPYSKLSRCSELLLWNVPYESVIQRLA